MNDELGIRNYRLYAVLILLLAAFFRLYHLPTLPPGLNFDEAGNGVAALDILAGLPRLWWTIGGGKEPLWPYVIAVSTAIFGPIPLALRLPAAAIGILTVAAVFPLIRSLTGSRAVALLTMLGLALSDWHLHFSRLGFRAILFPLFSTLAVYFFWQAFRRVNYELRIMNYEFSISNLQSLITNYRLLISALFTALSIYSYLAARLLPLVFVLFCLLAWLRTRRHFRPFLILLSTFFILTSLFLLPLILHFTFYPADLIARSTTVSIFNPEWNNGDLLGTAWQTLTLTLSTFLGLHGDPNPLVNLPDQPALPIFLVPFFLLGIVGELGIRNYELGRSNPPSNKPTNYKSPSLLLVWWIVLFLPALLAPEGAPHHLRLLGTIVPTYALTAVGVILSTNFLTRLLSQLPITNYQLPISNLQSLISNSLPLFLYAALALHTFNNTFIRWPVSTDFTLPFDLYATRLAAAIAQAPPDTAYVLPMDIRAADEARHYTLDYLLSDRPDAAYSYIPVDEANAERGLAQAAQGRDTLRVVRWTDDKHREADAKGIVTYLLDTNGTRVDRETHAVYDVETYSLVEQPAFTLPAIDQAIGAVFDDRLRLDAAYLPPQVSPGDTLPVALTLAPLAPMDTDYKASLRLLDSSGASVAQIDRQLRHNFHQGTSLWPPETVNEYYLVPIPPDAPPGDYTVVVVLYHPDTLAPLVANGLVEVSVGTVRVEE